MRYDYKKGIVEKDRRGHKKLWFGFFIFFGIIAYGGFLAASLFLNGWPLDSYDKTAQVVKSTKPGNRGDSLFIPVLNLTNTLNDSLELSGRPGKAAATIEGKRIGIGLTPDTIRTASPFFNLSQLNEGDEIFIDKHGVRYAYKVVKNTNDSKKLTLQNGDQKVFAESVGIVAWRDGQAQLETF